MAGRPQTVFGLRKKNAHCLWLAGHKQFDFAHKKKG